MPDVPTIAEAGYVGFEVNVWWGLFAPANMSREAVSELAGWVIAALNAPEVRPKLAFQGFHPVGLCGADFGSFLRKEYADYGRVIDDANIRGE